MKDKQSNENKYLFATIGSLTERGGRVTTAKGGECHCGLGLACVGDVVTYADGSEAVITDGAGSMCVTGRIASAAIQGFLIVVIRKRAFSHRGFMMHLTRQLSAVIVLAISSNCALAKTDPECLKHLGGGFSDAQCFAGLQADMVEENKLLYKEIRSKIPAGNGHAEVLDAYMAARDDGVKFCELQRDAGARWETNPEAPCIPRYTNSAYSTCAKFKTSSSRIC